MIRQMLAAVVLITFTGCVPAEQGASERPVVLLLKILVSFPANYAGLAVGLGLSYALCHWRLLILGWVAAALFNLPFLIALYAALTNEETTSGATFTAYVLICFGGAGGFGIGWLLPLIPASIRYIPASIRYMRRREQALAIFAGTFGATIGAVSGWAFYGLVGAIILGLIGFCFGWAPTYRDSAPNPSLNK